jgi:predicted TIM-barrel fold metal-dependent hydrolase
MDAPPPPSNVADTSNAIPFIDAHFHLWDLNDPQEPPAHDPKCLGGPGKLYPHYMEKEYLEDMEKVRPHGYAFDGAVFVEALPNQPVKETEWVSAMDCPWIKGMVSYAYLPSEDIEATLQAHSRFPKVRGIRQILNHHPDNPALTWPKVHSADYLTKDDAFRRGYALLQRFNMSFDMHVNPHQLKDAAAFVHNFPEIPVIVDHLGCLHLATSDKSEASRRISQWREGMQALAQQPHINLKISCLYHTRKDWFKLGEEPNTEVKDLALEMIRLFGSERCMFASNYPVDGACGTPIVDLYKAFGDFCSDLSQDDRNNLFHRTASRVYRL